MNNTSDLHYDCAIVGGGLAGLALAIQLAKANKKVILFEKESYPFHRVCGEYISMESWDYLEKLGIPLTTLNLPRIQKLKISSPQGKIINADLKPGGFGISRYSLDAILYESAVNCGVEVRLNTKVEEIHFEENNFSILSNSGNVSARMACGAFGKRSNLDVKMKRGFIQNTTDYVAVKYHVKADLPEDSIELHNFKDGYCGISKVDEGRYCLCYLTSSKNLKENNNSIAEMQEKVLMKNPYLKRYLSEFPSLYDKPLAISQISFAKKSLFENHVLMLGDAAGSITPLCGNGMSMALLASKISALEIQDFLDNKINRTTLETRYSSEWKKSFEGRLRAGRIFQQLFGNVWLTHLFISLVKPFSKLIAKLIDLTHGEAF